MLARVTLLLTALLVTSLAAAQDKGARTDCSDGWRIWGNRRVSVCETRELTLPAAPTLTVNARPNGSISVAGENRRDIQVRVVIQAWGRDEAEAQSIASEVSVRSDGVLRADGPDQHGRIGWSVSYEVAVPREIDLALETINGGIAVADVRGDLVLETLNGGIHLDGVAGDVRGHTTNGGVDATLTGNAWEGDGLDLRTTNGGVRLRVPEDYSARLETRTVNGHIDVDFPVTLQGRIGREISATLGDGGALVRAATTNGGVRVSRP